MEINIQNDRKIVEIWLTHAESTDTALRGDLQEIYAAYRAKNYTVAVFTSGQGDLYEHTRDLLLFNRRRSAELRQRKEKAAAIAR